MSHRSSTELINDCLERVDGAWPRFVDRHAGLVWMVIARYELDANDRSESFHATFAAAWTNLASVRDAERVHVWLTRIARNEVHRLFRNRRPEVTSFDLDRHFASNANGPEERLRALEMAHEVRAAVAALPQPYRATLECYLASGGKIDRQALAKQLNVQPETVRKTKIRALRMLRHRLVSFTEPGHGSQRRVAT